MARNTFSLSPQKMGRMKYLILTMGSSISLMYLFLLLTEAGILPNGNVWAKIYVYLPLVVMMVLGYFLIVKKNHTIDVKDNSIAETDWRRRVMTSVKTVQIRCYRRNFLGEIILLDEAGNKLLCVESNMTNFEQFQQWLENHNITQSKEK